mmetsp:Transcript_17581/g.49481  ORF Transcript_17581/g.49481 Transcript_17581/m.49481 type:complete len:269 (-) Transcript_17581:922-1728(-)
MPSSPATTRAVSQLSPVARWHLMRRDCNAWTTPAASGFTGSLMASTPAIEPATATSAQVCALPSAVRTHFSTAGAMLTPSWAISLRLPTHTGTGLPTFSCTRHTTPIPGQALKSVASGHGAPASGPSPGRPPPAAAAAASPPCCLCANCTTARPRGCSLCASAAAASASSRGWPQPPPSMVRQSVTCGRPWVSVPVLSNTMASTLCARSRASPPLMSRPWAAPTPVPTMTAVGVARPRAHGHATTTTAMPNSSEKRNTEWPAGSQDRG